MACFSNQALVPLRKLTQHPKMQDLLNDPQSIEKPINSGVLKSVAAVAEFELTKLWLEVWLNSKADADLPSALALRAAPEELREHLVIHMTRPLELRFLGSQAKLLDIKLATASETLSEAKIQIASQAFRTASEQAQPVLTKMIHPKAKLIVETLILPARSSLKNRGMCVSSVVFRPLTPAMKNRAPVEAVVLDVS